ncbi:MAG: nucleotide exchange factor GrpE [Desulfoprunum sp.]|uniref:nucleotide exchange factor GrpE n=1 Tax=Desulfoprunum sp. TaxID=2020866 RepID=UPI00052E1CE8|nr:heat shock protein GrpE [Desulfobulbus sp. Tol-SR]
MSGNTKDNKQELQEEMEVTGDVEETVATGKGEVADDENQVEAGPTEERNVEAELATALDEVVSLKDRMLRLAADSENFKKRMERERVAGLKYAGEQIFREMLPVVDNLERAIGQISTDMLATDKNLAALHEGVQLTLKSLVTILDKFEVKPIDSVGLPFDPNRQEALTMEPHETVPASHVVSEFEKGYFYKDRLLRPARVIVSSGKPAAQ